MFEQDGNQNNFKKASVGIAPARASAMLHSPHVGQHTTNRPKITTKSVS